MKKDDRKKQKSDARISGEIAFYVLIALAAFVFIFVYLGAQTKVNNKLANILANVYYRSFIECAFYKFAPFKASLSRATENFYYALALNNRL